MTGKMKLYIGLLVLGLAIIGSGVWMLAKFPPHINIPEEPPVIYEQIDYIMGGESNYLYIYDDGSIIYIEEKGFRPPGARHTKTWKTGNLTPHQMDNLLTYFENSGLHELDEDYQFPGEPAGHGGMYIGDMVFTISVNSGNLSKTVTASHYLMPPDMPPPLNEIYIKLKNIAETKTEEVYYEIIKSGIGPFELDYRCTNYSLLNAASSTLVHIVQFRQQRWDTRQQALPLSGYPEPPLPCL